MYTLIQYVLPALLSMAAETSIFTQAYGDYAARAQASEAPALLSGLKVPIAETYMMEGRCPTLAETYSITEGLYVASIKADTENCSYTATFKDNYDTKPALRGKTITMTYEPYNSTFVWSCDMYNNIRPSVCRDI